MSRFIDPTGQPTYGIGICARCSRKFPLAELAPDPNYPNLMVCAADRDEYDPYRLAPRAPDNVVLPFTRPDVPLTFTSEGLITESGNQFLTSESEEEFIVPKSS